tara:strand:- start:383 stop:757 length:375 start_codon:yes stop_codon:yes gene_type:complete
MTTENDAFRDEMNALYTSLYGSTIDFDSKALEPFEFAKRTATLMDYGTDMVSVPILTEDGQIAIFAYVSAKPTDPRVDSWYALGERLDVHGNWHEHGLPDGVQSIDPERIHMVPIFREDGEPDA